MAKIVVGIGTPKSPQVSLPPDHWLAHGDADRVGLEEAFDRNATTRTAELSEQLTPARLQERYDALQRDIAVLAESFEQAKPDVAVIYGDEDRDLSVDQNLPPFSIFTGKAITVEPLANWQGPEYNRPAMWAWYGENRTEYPVETDLGMHLVKWLMNLDFDVASCRGQQAGVSFNSSFSFVLRRIMSGLSVPIVPITLNAAFGATQPTPRRCYDFGKAVGQAIHAWGNSSRVAIVTAGGLSHRLIDEDFDRQVLEAMRTNDAVALRKLPVDRLSSGTGEVRCWVAAAATLEQLSMTLVNYHPCYRSIGGTGCGMAFARWTDGSRT